MTFKDLEWHIEVFNKRERRHNYRAAMVVAAIYNVNRGKERKNKPFTPEEILGEKKKEDKGNDMLEAAKAWTAAMGGEVKQ